MKIYRIQYTRIINRITRDIVLFIEAVDDDAAIIVANGRFPIGVINKKLYNVGTKVSLE